MFRTQRLSNALIFALLLSSSFAFGQTYYSNFSNPSDQFLVSSPSGGICLAPAASNGAFIADSDTTNFASVSALLGTPLLCTNGSYIFNTYLNLPLGVPSVDAGAQAGFKVRFSTLLSATVLGNNISIRTYQNGELQETASGGASVLGLDILSTTGMANLYFITTKPFNQVELVMGSALISVGVLFEADVYYGYASQSVLPVTIANVKATASNGSATVSWQSLNETNLNHYEVERSKDGTHFALVGSVKSGSNASSAYYNYTDKTVPESDVWYRVKAVDNDGSYTTSRTVAISITGSHVVKIYPSPARAGQTVQVTLPQAGKYSLLLYDAQGRLVKQQQGVAASSSVSLSTSGLATGSYQIRLLQGSAAMQARLIIQK